MLYGPDLRPSFLLLVLIAQFSHIKFSRFGGYGRESYSLINVVREIYQSLKFCSGRSSKFCLRWIFSDWREWRLQLHYVVATFRNKNSRDAVRQAPLQRITRLSLAATRRNFTELLLTVIFCWPWSTSYVHACITVAIVLRYLFVIWWRTFIALNYYKLFCDKI